MEFYGYKKCSTCRDAHKLLTQNGIQVEFKDFVEQPPSVEQLRSWIDLHKEGVMAFVNAKGTRFRELGLKDRQLSDAEWIQMMSEDGKLLKRPVLVAGNRVIVGFDKAAYAAVVESDDAS